MKKLALFSILAIGLGMASCDNDFDFPNPPGQSNPQETIFDTANLKIESAVSETINLGDINNADALVALAEITGTDSVAGYDLKFIGEMATSDAFTSPVEFPVIMDGAKLCADPDVLDATCHKAFNTLDPGVKSTYIRYKGYAVNGSTQVRLGGDNVYFCPMTAEMKLFTPAYTIEENYYIIGTCSDGKIDATKAIKMSNSGASPYDDPIFTAVVNISNEQASAGYQWAVVPATTLAAGSGVVIAPTDVELAAEAKGYLMNYTTTGTWGIIDVAAPHIIKVNMQPDEDGFYSYTVELAIPNLYTPGPANNWSQAASQLLYTDNYSYYMGFAHIQDQVKFTSAPDWEHVNYGFASEGKLSTDGGAGNIEVSQNGEPLTDGLYWCTADIVALTYTTTAINTLSIIGDATEGGWDSDTQMTPSADLLTWTVTTTLTQGSFKFRANNAWDVNLGGALDNLVFNSSDNIPAPTTGKVTITLDLSTIPYTATVK